MALTEILFSQNWIVSLVFWLLLFISIFSWYVIFKKIMFFKNEQNALKSLQGQGVALLVLQDIFAICQKIDAKNEEIIAKKIALKLEKIKEQYSFGQNFLASIANLAPFIGLFGTVLGVYFALLDIASQGSANIAVVARPIGEALIATAMGLWCAIPASFAYNFFAKKSTALLRQTKILVDEKIIAIQEKK